MKRSFLFLLCAAAIAALLIVVFPSWYFWGRLTVASLAVFAVFESLFLLERTLNKIPWGPWERVVGAILIIGATGFMVLLSKMPPPHADLAVLVTMSVICAVGAGSWIWRFAKWIPTAREQKKYPGADPFTHN